MDILDMVQLVSSIAISLMGIGWSKWQVFLLSFPSSEYQESWVLKSKPHSIQCEALPREIHVLWFSSFTSDWSVSMLSGGGGFTQPALSAAVKRENRSPQHSHSSSLLHSRRGLKEENAPSLHSWEWGMITHRQQKAPGYTLIRSFLTEIICCI